MSFYNLDYFKTKLILLLSQKYTLKLKKKSRIEECQSWVVITQIFKLNTRKYSDILQKHIQILYTKTPRHIPNMDHTTQYNYTTPYAVTKSLNLKQFQLEQSS